jgi:hypothetical protein
MVIAAFVIASAVVILALGAFQGAARAQQEQTRLAVEQTLGLFLSDLEVPDHAHARGRFGDVGVEVAIGHHAVTLKATLPNVMVRFADLVERFAPPSLRAELHALQLELSPRDVVTGALPLEPVVTDTLVTLERRLALIGAVADLRAHAPAVLLERLKTAHGSRDVDELLLALTYAFPHAQETEQAIAHAAELEHAHPDRVRERAESWRAAGRLPAFPIR